jgi:hypothetical protein
MKRSARRACAILAAGAAVAAALAISADADAAQASAMPASAMPASATQASATPVSATSASATPAHEPKLTGDEIAGKAIADLRGASSVRVYTNESVLGLSITISETYTEHSCLENFSVSGPGTAAVSENILIVGSSVWVQPSNEFWSALGYSKTQLASLDGKWLTFGAFEKLFGISGLPAPHISCGIRSVSYGLTPTGWKLVKSVKVSGRWAWRVVNTADKTTICIEKGHCESSALSAYVSDARRPEFLSMTEFRITEYFSDYNAAITLAAPPAADVLTSVPQPPGGTPPLTARRNPLTQLIGAATATH